MSKAPKISINQNEPSGSPHKGEPVYLVIGKIRRPHGIAGEMLCEMTTENPDHFNVGNRIFIGANKKPYNIISVRQANKFWLIALEGFENREQVALLNNQSIFLREEDLGSLPDGRFYHHEVIGMQVLDENNALLGKVSDILVTGANDVYVVETTAGDELMIPALKSVVLSIDRDSNSMVIRPQEWA